MSSERIEFVSAPLRSARECSKHSSHAIRAHVYATRRQYERAAMKTMFLVQRSETVVVVVFCVIHSARYTIRSIGMPKMVECVCCMAVCVRECVIRRTQRGRKRGTGDGGGGGG